jgi:hypothetical protein
MIISEIENLGKWSCKEIEVVCDNCKIEIRNSKNMGLW